MSGVTTRSDVPVEPDLNYRLLLIQLLISLFATLTLYLILPNFSLATARLALDRPMRSLMVGLGVVLAVPIVAAVLMLTTIGSLFALWVMVVYLGLVFMGSLLAGLIYGLGLMDLLHKISLPIIWWLVIGASLAHLLWLVPVLGPLVIMLMLFLAVGAVVEVAYLRLRD